MINAKRSEFDVDIELRKIGKMANEIISQRSVDDKDINDVLLQYISKELGCLINNFSSVINHEDFLKVEYFLDSFAPEPFLLGLAGRHFDEEEYKRKMKNIKNQIDGLYKVKKHDTRMKYISLVVSIVATLISLIALFK